MFARLEVALSFHDIRQAVGCILHVARGVIVLRDVCVLQADMQRRGRDRALADEHGIAMRVRAAVRCRDLIVRIVRAVRILQRKALVRHSMLTLRHIARRIIALDVRRVIGALSAREADVLPVDDAGLVPRVLV